MCPCMCVWCVWGDVGVWMNSARTRTRTPTPIRVRVRVLAEFIHFRYFVTDCICVDSILIDKWPTWYWISLIA